MTNQVLFYDYQRDGEIPPGCILFVYEDGHTELQKLRKGIIDVRTEGIRRKRSIVRGRPVGTSKRLAPNTRQASAGKRAALRKIGLTEPGLSA